MEQIEVREGARRQHRTIALFAVLQCWLRGLDGVVLDRDHLERLIGLERFKGKRINWINADFEEFFPFREVYYYANKQKSLGSLYIARRKLKGVLPDGNMSDEERLSQIPKDGPRLAMFSMWPRPTALRRKAWPDPLRDGPFGGDLENEEHFQTVVPFFKDWVNTDERLLAAYLALLSQGQVSPSSIPFLTD